ncbi:cytochrome c biogenesis protein ResB [Spiractinospora alimapuensis]|uniref:cytochrome c biogenesis protein ResB n=1 Tax=Spiractinospora alimapuensis TaxID=2820884 RepID=UPI001F3A1620|nr:cytochrome c biogenesis protein ResB [Spiractinospora alimapuensis]QVQ50978.1 cytochrome c biogenesis protein ResB [Spiractinospora alimapuensis]
MRTALILLFLLALAAIPGSILPQREVSVEQVQNYYLDNPDLAPWLERFYLFDVYSSPWFAAIYLLLFVSLVGCVLPRMAKHFQAMRSRPPKTPKVFSRLPYSARFTTSEPPERVEAEARRLLRGYRVDSGGDESPEGRTAGDTGDEEDDDATSETRPTTRWVAAERGYLRETGNLVFHMSLVGLLLALAMGSLFGYRGNTLVVEGDGFANAVTSYDNYFPGSLTEPEHLAPFTMWLDDFTAEFHDEGPVTGQAADFEGQVRYRAAPDAEEGEHVLKVNDPLSVDGTQVYLLGTGYAPEFEVRDSRGELVYDQPVPFLLRDEFTYMSDGVLKVPDADPDQLGFVVEFAPTAGEGGDGELVSTFPEARDPAVSMEAYVGDLGLDSGEPQSVYRLYASQMESIGESPVLELGDTWDLPDEQGSVTFTGFRPFMTLQVNSDPGRIPALVAASAAVAGLLVMFLVRPRRCWVRARRDATGQTVVEIGGLERTGDGAADEFHEMTRELQRRTGQRTDKE